MIRIGECVPEGVSDLEISRLLRGWYAVNRRALPWRETRDPYLVWISEIILQQTRVAQGLAYYLRFTRRFPDVASLAAAEEDEVLKYWQGLGYYSRARNLLAAARMVMERFGGRFPDAYKDVLSLRGIGDYTAAAIVSFAWDQPYPVVDGNVYRVLSRLFAVDTPTDTAEGKRLFARLAGEILDPDHAALHNQAIMELGALVCLPRNPACPDCPLADRCAVRAAGGDPEAFPVKRVKPKIRERYLHYLYIIYKGQTWLRRRGEGDIWTGLYEFPLIETERQVDFAELSRGEMFRRMLGGTGGLTVSMPLVDVRHQLSHQTLHASFHTVEVEREPAGLSGYMRLSINEVEKYAVPRLIQIYLDQVGM